MDQYASGLTYAVDIVFVIDVTGSMEPVLQQVQRGALSFHRDLINAMEEKHKRISSLRVRLIAFRDYLHDEPADAMLSTEFMTLPDDLERFEEAVNFLEPFGGGDEPESGLEALAFAIHSDWERGLDRRRHIVVLFTDASAHPLELASDTVTRINGSSLPTSLDELTDLWEEDEFGPMEYSAKRLLLYAPETRPWDEISSAWSNTLHYMSRAGEGLADYEFREIIESIANSV